MAEKSDYEWLISNDAEIHFERVLQSNKPINALEALRKAVGIERAELIFQLLDLRHRAKSKFSKAERMFFTAKSLEQATDERIANLKADRFKMQGRVADLCCGIGGDTLSIATVAEQVESVDLDSVTALLCEANCVAHGLSNVCMRTSDVSEFDIAKYDAWHIDPDRRETGARTVRPENFAPDLPTILSLIQQNQNAAVKMAPATETNSDWMKCAELHWYGHSRSCQQLVAYFGDLAKYPGKRVATILGDREHRTVIDQAESELAIAASVQNFIYEPHAAILASGCTRQIAAQHNLMAIIPGGGYLTSDDLTFDPAISSFKVLESMPFHEKRVRQALKKMDVGTVEVKKRAVDIDPFSLQAKWKGKGSNRLTVFILRRNQAVSAIIAQRLSDNATARLAIR